MISHVNGTVAHLSAEHAVIDVGGVGLRIQCTPGTLAGLRSGQTAAVSTSLVVREDSLALFGFASADERDVFELLQTASGVGPKLALAMLAVLSPDALRRAVAAEDVAALTRVPGIGRKGAQRIILELAGRLGVVGDGGGGIPGGAVAGRSGQAGAAPAWREQVRAGLVNLGWQARDAEQAIAAVEADLAQAALDAGGGSGTDGADGADGTDGADGGRSAMPDIDVADALRAALRKLSRT